MAMTKDEIQDDYQARCEELTEHMNRLQLQIEIPEPRAYLKDLKKYNTEEEKVDENNITNDDEKENQTTEPAEESSEQEIVTEN